MSSRKSDSGFMRKLAWTVVLALVFSAGLITGQRLIRSEPKTPLVSVSSKSAEPAPGSSSPDQTQTSRPIFSFYDRLSRGIDSDSSDEAKTADKSDGKSSDKAPEESETASDEQTSDADKSAETSGAEERDDSPADETSDESATDESTEPPEEADNDAADNADNDAADKNENAPSAAPEKASEKSDDSKESDSPNQGAGSASKYTLQVSAYPSLDRARARVRSLSNKGLDAHVVSAKVPDKGTYYRVRIGGFESMDAAKKFQDELARKRGVETFVTPL